MEDYVKHLLAEAEKILSTHVNEENPLRDDAEKLYAQLVNLQSGYAEYLRKLTI